LASAESLSCIVPPGMLCPTSPSLPWVAWASLPHIQRYYATLRLPPSLLGVLRLSLVPRYLACFQAFVVSLVGSCPGGSATDHARAFGHPVPRSGNVSKETDGSPKFPSYPSGHMPRSQTPVVSCALAIPHPGLLPSGQWKPSAFLSVPPGEVSFCPRRYLFRGSITRPASSLHPAPYGPLRGGMRVHY
jgi:hypothetical protein